MKTLLFALVTLVCLSSCSDFTDENHYEVDSDLQYYTDRFFSEASDRGLSIKPSSLIVVLGNCQAEDGVVGITKYKSITTVTIDRIFFESRKYNDTLLIETVVFHELGHAVMHREHCDGHSLMNPNKYVSEYRLYKDKRIELTTELLNYNN